jgi:hypothetical protein
MALVLNSSRLRLTTANWFGNPHSGGGSISLTEGAGITLNPDPLTGAGSVALTVPVTVSNGGSGAITLTGYLKGTGATPFTTAATVPTSDISGTLGVDKGGTGIATMQTGYVPFGNGTSPFGSDLSFQWDNTNKRLGIGGVPAFPLHVISSVGTTRTTRYGTISQLDATAADAAQSRVGLRGTVLSSLTSGAIGHAIGVYSVLSGVGNGGTTTEASNLLSHASVSAGHTFASRYGARISDATGAGVVTNQYGVYVEPLSKGGTSNYAVYTAGTTLSYFGGMVESATAFRGHIQDNGGRVISVDAYGALADAVENATASVPVGTPNLTLGTVVASNGFSTSDIGKPIAVQGAGNAGGVLTTTVSAVGAGAEGQKASCTLNTVALTDCISGRAVWGTDNTTTIQAAFNANVDQARGHTIEFSTGNYLVNGAISLPNQNTTVRGQGKGATNIYQISTTANTFDVTFSAASIEFENFTIHGMGPKCTAGHAIGWTGAVGPYFECLVSNVQIKDVYTALECTYEGSVGMRVTNTEIIGTSGDSVRWDGGIEAENVLIYQIPTGPAGVAVSIGVGTNTFTMTSGSVSSKDVGKKIGIYGAGGSATTPLITTIASVTSGTTGTTAANATSTAVAQMATIEYPAPSCWHVMNGGPMLRNVHMIGGDYGLWISPDTGDTVQWLFADALDCDSSRLYGLYIAPTGTGNAQMFQINNSWFASSAMGGWAGRAENTAAIKLVGQAGTPINGVSISDSTIGHNAKYGVHSDRCFNLTFDNCTIDTNSILLANTYDHINVNNCGNFSIKNSGLGSRYSSFGVTTNCRYGVVLTANVNGHISILGNSFTQMGTGALSDSSTVATKMIKDNPGLNPLPGGTPAVPATTVTASNTNGSDVMVYIVTDGATTVTVIAVNGATTGHTMAVSSQKAVQLPAGGTIALTYAGGTPTWTWIGS